MNSHFQRLLGPNNFSIGLELPLDNDWSTAGQRLRMSERYAALRRSSRYARKNTLGNVREALPLNRSPATANPASRRTKRPRSLSRPVRVSNVRIATGHPRSRQSCE